ncbi:AAA family ATPase [Halorubrum sp. AD140]|uniref:AAA family ATPase n=1 Tax=Halorubrum sp. AD140 TaxID=3050073 RepID=UPI002ACC6A82|nr:AAA family ATPase [Halorubrum sp. AD140]MDZ5809968.1 AAA family ATPase [Halorubrum sp. AD140]
MSTDHDRTPEATLRVASARGDASADDGGVRIGPDAMESLGLNPGDVVVLEGPRGSVAARAWPADPEDDGAVRVTHWARQSLGAGVDDTVTAGPAVARDADGAVLALPDAVDVDDALGLSFRDALVGRVLSPGQVVPVALGLGSVPGAPEQTVPVKVVETSPSGPVVVREGTRLTVSEEPATDVELPSAVPEGHATYDDVGGLDEAVRRLRETVELPMRNPSLFRRLGANPPTGVLLHGPSGAGKTLLANAVANELDVDVVRIRAPEVTSAHRGESEERLRDAFSQAAAEAPSLLILDELDAVAGDRARGGEGDGRLVGQLLSLLDGLDEDDPVMVIGTANRVDAIDPALRRPGRFDREIEVGVPDRDGREEILDIHARGLRVSDGVDLGAYAENTHGFVGADLEALVTEASMNAIRRVWPDLADDPASAPPEAAASVAVTDEDFRAALREVEPSALRAVSVEVPDVTWDDVGGLTAVKERLRETVQWPLEHPEAFARVALEPDRGILLYGPPGTGKTLLAKAVANESESNFVSVKGPELLDKYVGESEKGVREVFSKARQNAPTVVFFDEIDSIAAERGGSTDASVGERVVSQLLTELDGLEEMEDVVVVATTNRKDLIDDALLRAGRIERHLRVPRPDAAARREIFAVHCRDRPLADDVDVDALVDRTEGYVGADIEAVCREAAAAAVREYVRDDDRAVDDIRIAEDHFERALREVTPSEDEDAASSSGESDPLGDLLDAVGGDPNPPEDAAKGTSDGSESHRGDDSDRDDEPSPDRPDEGS